MASFRKLHISKYLPILFLIPSIILNFVLLYQARLSSNSGVVVIGVIDGDTVVLEGKSRVRLRYVDAPEKGLCGYDQATRELENLVMGKSVRIEETIPDTYGRGMALVYVGSTLINKEMLASGWVRYHHDNSAVTEEVKAASDLARQEKRGIYGACQSTTNSKNPKCLIKGNIDKSTDTHLYYISGCAQYAFTIVEEDIGEQWFCTEKEALAAGFTRAATCKY
ncbi:thermonuclease family protein [Patescibacteria group bacterium]|nr:thermonuclease family protein [Patescibacteria group bacterium]MBU1472273.1 thermonuclease family protein [Patescibacteria group bacterium]MBU2460476.1 thermonuclease family protein [Patescibacteria group bacterium]MBU2544011.1 thermonuclease family protein [Patescibacteria group bacterium]